MATVAGRKSLRRVALPCAALAGVLMLASLLLGAGNLSVMDSVRALFGQGSEEHAFIVFELRWPRTILAVLVGVALGAAGTIMQAATRNPLAEPGLLGVSAGASFAVVLAIFLGADTTGVHFSTAILGALAGCALVLLTTQLRGAGTDPVRLVLAGAAFSSILISITTLILLHDQRSADEIRFWVIGALGGRPASHLQWAVPGLLTGLAIVGATTAALAAMSLGEKVAMGLGHKPILTRILAMAGVAVLVGTATAAAGPIAFAGLIVPYFARRLVGPDVRRALPTAMLLGPSVLLLSDILSRLAVRPYELPIGVVTACIGAPVLIAVVRSHRLPRL
ncbi:MAG TPA: iron ABC transporter permease [Burkholderiaceae bacterium]|nr:iron ABC transporter permease [Burkholderiaceae bacterium]